MKRNLILDMVAYLLEHRGPDGEGRGHPHKQRLQCRDLEEAIALAEHDDKSFSSMKPYHVRNTLGVWNNPHYVDEVIIKKIDQLLADNYGGDLFALIQKTSSDELCTPLRDVLHGKQISVSMHRVFSKMEGSPFTMVCRYIELKGLQKAFWGIRSYHFNISGPGTFQDAQTVDTLLQRKIDQLLASEKYKGDLVELITHTHYDEIFGHFIDELNGKPVEVPMGTVAPKVGYSPYGAVCRYIELKGLQKEFWGIRQYHFNNAPINTFDDTTLVNEMVAKKINQLLSTTYHGDWGALAEQVSVAELFGSFTDTLNDKEVRVSLSRLQKFLNTRKAVLDRYHAIQSQSPDWYALAPPLDAKA